MNDSENKIKEKYKSLGYTIIHKGAPDFLIFKKDESNDMFDIKFIEVKNGINDILTDEQEIWITALKTLCCECNVMTPNGIIDIKDIKNKTMKCRKCRKCGKCMTKLYRHWNQFHVGGQWEAVKYWCSSCNTICDI